MFEEKYYDISRAYCMKAPTNEAAYAFHDQSPLKLYDCLIPKIRDHVRNVAIYCEPCRAKA